MKSMTANRQNIFLPVIFVLDLVDGLDTKDGRSEFDHPSSESLK